MVLGGAVTAGVCIHAAARKQSAPTLSALRAALTAFFFDISPVLVI